MKRTQLILVLVVLLAWAYGCKKEGEIPDTNSPLPQVPTVGAVTEVGTPFGEISIKTIGSAGGVLISKDGNLILTVPAGALSEDVIFSIQAISGTTPNGLLHGWKILPKNIKLNKKLSLCWKFTKKTLAGRKPEDLYLAYQNESKVWNATKDLHIDRSDSTICFNNIEDLKASDWNFTSSICMRTTILTDSLLLGTPENLMISGVSMGNKYWNPLPKEKIFHSQEIEATTVNGIDTGDDYVGNLHPKGWLENDYSARYIAPLYKVPTVNPVELKAIVKAEADMLNEVVSNMYIRRGNNSVTIAAEGKANTPHSLISASKDQFAIQINDEEVVSPKVWTGVTIYIKGSGALKTGTYPSGESLDIRASRTGSGQWNNKYNEHQPNGSKVVRYGDGSVTITSISYLPGEISGKLKGAIVKGTYNVSCYRLKGGSETYERSGVSGTFEGFGYL